MGYILLMDTNHRGSKSKFVEVKYPKNHRGNKKNSQKLISPNPQRIQAENAEVIIPKFTKDTNKNT